jgi:hypothetical protein
MSCYGASFTFYMWMIFVPRRKHLLASTACYGEIVIFYMVDDFRISQETHLWASTSCYGNSFTFLYVADVRTSQEAHVRSSTAYLGGDNFVSF